MTNGEIISGYRCDACCVGDKTVDITKKVVVKELPNTLIVHLNRIIFDMDTLRNVKVNDRFEFPEKLNMKSYMLDEVISKDKEAMKKKKAAAAA